MDNYSGQNDIITINKLTLKSKLRKNFMNRPDKLFCNGELSDFFEHLTRQIKSEINSQNNDYIANIDLTEYIKYFEEKYKIESPIIFEEGIETVTKQAKVTVTDSFYGTPVSVDGVIITISLPYNGEANAILTKASTYTMNPPTGYIKDNFIETVFRKTVYEIESFNLESAVKNWVANIETHIEYTQKDINSYNNSIKNIVTNEVQRIRDNYEKFNSFNSTIPFKLKEESNKPSTFVIPTIPKKIPLPPKPTTIAKTEPTIQLEVYEHILSICSDMAIVMERSPKAFATLDEEGIRTHFLMHLNGHYAGLATGETFNMGGKTDILIRINNENVFIAECKFWNGEKLYLQTIDQLLGYVSYRDTKTAILIFNKNKNFTEVIEKIKSSTKDHPNYVKEDSSYSPPQKNLSFRYIFKNANDDKKEFLLTVMAFNIPQD